MRLCAVFAVVLCAAATSFGAITLTDGTGTTVPWNLNYTDPADLGTQIDPIAVQADTLESFGIAKATFQALNPQVVTLNAPTASFTNPLAKIVANYSATATVSFAFPAPGNYTSNFSTTVGYNYGGAFSSGRQAFSGPNGFSDISTVPSKTDDGLAGNALDAKITSTGAMGVEALGFCVAARTTTTSAKAYATNVIFTLSDGSTDTSIALPDFGGATTHTKFFIGYQAPAGLTITRVQIPDRDTGFGAASTNMTLAIDDLSFVMTPEPATLALLALGGLAAARRRRCA